MLSRGLVIRNLRVSRGGIGWIKLIYRREAPDPFCKECNIGFCSFKAFLRGKEFRIND